MIAYSIEILKEEATLDKFKKQAYEQALLFEKEKIIIAYEHLYESLINYPAYSI